MRKLLLAPVLVIFMVLNTCGQSEQITGLWLIEKVRVGGQEMTPVARWTRIHADGSYESGNGWLKSSEGVWTYDEHEKALLPIETNGIIDPFGAFTVDFEGDAMLWKREEEGMEVRVILNRIEELPKAPADKVQGLWGLKDVVKGEDSILSEVDPDGKHYIFFKWGRTYEERSPEGNRQTGYWHMHDHRPELTVLPHRADQEAVSWKVSFNEKGELILTGISGSNRDQRYVYSRLDRFPD